MNILLINLPVKFNAFENSQPPLGVAYLAAVCRKAGFEQIQIKDYEVEPFELTVFSAELQTFRPDVVGLSCRTASYPAAVQMAETLRNLVPNALIVFGGHHPTALAQDVLAETTADVVVRKEGEETFPSLLKALETGVSFSQVAGISYRSIDGTIHNNPDRGYLTNLDALPFPAWDLLPMQRYAYGVVLSSRGCPFHCIYCDKNISTSEVRYRSEESVVNEIAALLTTWKQDLIYFDDDHFLLNKERFFRIMDMLEARGICFKWKCQARVDSIDVEVLQRARQTGCVEILFGVETGDPSELEFIQKAGNATLEQTRKVFRWARESGITTRANFMLGFPVSTPETVANTIRFAAELKADNYRFFHVVPLPNTNLWDYCVARHMIPSIIKWQDFTFSQAILQPEGLPAELLQTYSGAAYLHVFGKKVVREFTIELLPRLVRFVGQYRKIGKVSSTLFRTFPAFANMAAEIWFLMANKNWSERWRFLRGIWAMERTLS